MTPELFESLERRGGCVKLSDRAKFRLTGADRVRYLNGQVTNDVRKATADAALHACVTNAKGRIEGDVFIHVPATGDALYLDAEPGLRESLALRLEKYIVADDVVLEDVTDEWTMCHVFGAAAESPEAQRFATAQPDQGRFLRNDRFGAPGYDIWVKGANLEVGVLAGMELCAADVETWRICKGIPRWPHELNSEVFPQEAGLEATAMDFAKGCYIGQEVLSRIKMTGKMPRRLIRFSVPYSGPDTLHTRLSDPHPVDWKLCVKGDGALREAGVVTSAVLHPVLDRVVGLGYVRQGFEAEDSLLLACEDPPRIYGSVDITPP